MMTGIEQQPSQLPVFKFDGWHKWIFALLPAFRHA